MRTLPKFKGDDLCGHSRFQSGFKRRKSMTILDLVAYPRSRRFSIDGIPWTWVLKPPIFDKVYANGPDHQT